MLVGDAWLTGFVERTLGGLDIFLKYINDYVNTFMGKSITTFQWKDHLYEYFRKNYGDEKIKALDSVDWDVSVLEDFCYAISDLYVRNRLGFTEKALSSLSSWTTI